MSAEIPDGGKEVLDMSNPEHWPRLVRDGVIQPATAEEVARLLEEHGLRVEGESTTFSPEDLVIEVKTGSGSPGYTGKKPDAIVYRVGGPLSDTGIQ